MTNFEKAVALDNEKWLEYLPEEAPEYEFSEKYNKFRIKLFDKMRGEKYHRFTKRATIAIIVAAILLSMTVVTLAATLGKEFIIKHFSGYAAVEVEDGKEDVKSVNSFDLGYIPKGFSKIDEFITKETISYSYSKNELWFNISKSKISGSMTFDEEENSVEKIVVDNTEYLFQTSDESSGLIWNDGFYIYEINGNLNKDELIRISQLAK